MTALEGVHGDHERDRGRAEDGEHDAEYAARAPDGPSVTFGAASDPGPHRQVNEDAWTALTASAAFPAHLFAVADGLGGYAAGEVASRIVIDHLREVARTTRLDRPDRWLRHALHTANLAVYDHSRVDGDAFGCQSTASVLLLHDDTCVIAHVGDCRVYRVRDGTIEQRTTDHTRAAEMLRLRILTPEQALHHPARSQLTRSLGAEVMVHADIARATARAGDVYVACSDGLWNEVSRGEVADTVQRLPPSEAAPELLRIALQREASDNVTVVVVRIEHVEHQAAERPRRWLPWR